MGLGPQIQLRQSQQLVMTPQLTQAIRLLALSNVELEAAIAEEMAKNPLLETQSGEDEGDRGGEEPGSGEDFDEAPDDPGADDLILARADDDRPLDVDWTAEALETDSFADVLGSAGGEEAFDFVRLE